MQKKKNYPDFPIFDAAAKAMFLVNSLSQTLFQNFGQFVPEFKKEKHIFRRPGNITSNLLNTEKPSHYNALAINLELNTRNQ